MRVPTPLHSQQQPADVAAALKIWGAASLDRQTARATAFDTALTNADDDLTRVPAGNYGPVPALAKGLTAMAVSSALDGVLMAQGGFYQTDFTKQSCSSATAHISTMPQPPRTCTGTGEPSARLRRS
jgi:hypothetical protein